jgi:hypothetical protein
VEDKVNSNHREFLLERCEPPPPPYSPSRCEINEWMDWCESLTCAGQKSVLPLPLCAPTAALSWCCSSWWSCCGGCCVMCGVPSCKVTLNSRSPFGVDHVEGRERRHGGMSSFVTRHVASLTPSVGYVCRVMADALPSEESACPQSFLDPVTFEILRDPVLTEDGQTFERDVIERWFTDHTTSPLTGGDLSSRTLIPNFALRHSIEEWRTLTHHPPRLVSI